MEESFPKRHVKQFAWQETHDAGGYFVERKAIPGIQLVHLVESLFTLQVIQLKLQELTPYTMH